jgi:hypothetical protein
MSAASLVEPSKAKLALIGRVDEEIEVIAAQ